jgi:hypothetical protein
MRKPKTVTTSRGCVVGEGPNKNEAKLDLSNKIDFLCNAQAPHIEFRWGMTLIVAASPVGEWCYLIIESGKAAEHHGKTLWMNGLGSRPMTMSDAISKVRMFAAQRAWEPRRDDELFVFASACKEAEAAELRSWVKWQRSYAKHKLDGKTDAEAHQLASSY